MSRIKIPPRTDTEIRGIVLEYFYGRNKNATSARSDKTGVAAKISVVNRDLKASHQLRRQDIRRNLTYLISEGWIQEEPVLKHVRLPSGVMIPQCTSYYKITASGMDKIDGPGEFTMQKFHGVNISAVGQSIVTVGDGNQVNARFSGAGNALADLRRELVSSTKLTDDDKLSAVADIDAMQSQLAKKNPCASVIRTLWSGVESLATTAGLIIHAREVARMLSEMYATGG